MKRYLTLAVCFVLMAMLTSCIVFREMRALVKHAPSIRDGRLFAHDTIANDAKNMFHFAELPLHQRVLDTLKLTFANYKKPVKDKTFAEYTCMDGGASAFIIIQNDTIKYEHYNGWLKKLGH